MSIALDLGTHCGRSLRRGSTALIRRQQRSLAVFLADGPAARRWLEQCGAPFLSCDAHLVVTGDVAAELGTLFPVACRDLLPGGRVPYGDAVARQLILREIELLLPIAPREGAVCCFAQPAYGMGEADRDPAFDGRLEFVNRVVRLRGYNPVPVNPALALVLAEMEPDQFTGIGICVGASGADLVLTRHGVSLASTRIDRGGRALDERIARKAGRLCIDVFGQPVLDVEWARRERESLLDGLSMCAADNPLSTGTSDLLGRLVEGVKDLLSAVPSLRIAEQPLSIVVGGGVAQTAGFEPAFRKQLDRMVTTNFPLSVRLATDAATAVLRGCLIQACLESQRMPERVPA